MTLIRDASHLPGFSKYQYPFTTRSDVLKTTSERARLLEEWARVAKIKKMSVIRASHPSKRLQQPGISLLHGIASTQRTPATSLTPWPLDSY